MKHILYIIVFFILAVIQPGNKTHGQVNLPFSPGKPYRTAIFRKSIRNISFRDF